jgi:Ser/Thr protein kinase RdoA (MazF antagonist)
MDGAEPLTTVLAKRYGLVPIKLEPVPDGFTRRTWSARTEDSRYAVKVRVDRTTVARLDALREVELGVRIPIPLRTRRGRLVARPADGEPVAVFEWLDGEPLADWPAWPATVLASIGNGIARLHQAAARLPRRRDVRMHSGSLTRSVTALGWYADEHHQPDALVRDLLSDRLPALLEVRRVLREQNGSSGGPLVLCHTDLYADNLVVDESGSVGVLDWDEAALAPAEADFAVIARDQSSPDPLAAVVSGYRSAGGGELSIDAMRWHILTRLLGDGVARLPLVADPAMDPAEREQAALGIDAWCLEPAARLEEILEVTRRSLDPSV